MLHEAVRNCNAEEVSKLSLSDIIARDGNRRTAFHIAADSDKTETCSVIEALFAIAGRDPGYLIQADTNGFTPLHAAASGNAPMVQWLLRHGGHNELEANNGLTAWDIADTFGQRSAIQAIQAHRAEQRQQLRTQ